jgi:hypothetical protein
MQEFKNKVSSIALVITLGSWLEDEPSNIGGACWHPKFWVNITHAKMNFYVIILVLHAL